MEKFLDYLDENSINAFDRYTGDTLLHYVLGQNEEEKILKILEKGGDIMAKNCTPESYLNTSREHLDITCLLYTSDAADE